MRLLKKERPKRGHKKRENKKREKERRGILLSFYHTCA
jgi:hypothetical protein